MSEWHVRPYQITLLNNESRTVMGYRNDLWGIRRSPDYVGWDVTHLPSGFRLGPNHCFPTLRAAKEFCKTAENVCNWKRLTPKSCMRRQKEILPKINRIYRKAVA